MRWLFTFIFIAHGWRWTIFQPAVALISYAILSIFFHGSYLCYCLFLYCQTSISPGNSYRLYQGFWQKVSFFIEENSSQNSRFSISFRTDMSNILAKLQIVISSYTKKFNTFSQIRPRPSFDHLCSFLHPEFVLQFVCVKLLVIYFKPNGCKTEIIFSNLFQYWL